MVVCKDVCWGDQKPFMLLTYTCNGQTCVSRVCSDLRCTPGFCLIMCEKLPKGTMRINECVEKKVDCEYFVDAEGVYQTKPLRLAKTQCVDIFFPNKEAFSLKVSLSSFDLTTVTFESSAWSGLRPVHLGAKHVSSNPLPLGRAALC